MGVDLCRSNYNTERFPLQLGVVLVFLCYLMIEMVTMCIMKDINVQTCQINRILDMEKHHPKNGYLKKNTAQSSRRLIILIMWSEG